MIISGFQEILQFAAICFGSGLVLSGFGWRYYYKAKNLNAMVEKQDDIIATQQAQIDSANTMVEKQQANLAYAYNEIKRLQNSVRVVVPGQGSSNVIGPVVEEPSDD